MFKKIEVLNKEKFKSMKFADLKSEDVAKQTGVMPLGFNEIIDMTYFSPVLIMGSEDALEFVAFTGVSPKVTIFNNENVYMPMFTQTYPFINMIVKDENDQLRSVIGIDNDKDVSKRKKNFIFNKEGELQKIASAKIEQIRELNRQRDVSKRIIKELKDNDLLLKKDFKIIFDEKEKIILDNFYVVNRDKLTSLDDKIVALWAKKGWMSIIDCHIRSLKNFERVLASVEK